MLDAKLIVVGGDAKATEVQLKLPTVIGRGRESTLVLPHPLVSRRHTEILERDGQLIVRDLGSLNGTFVNNQKIEDEQVLAPNQLLTLGNVTFRAAYESAAFPSSADSASDDQVAAPMAQRCGEADGGEPHLETTTLPPQKSAAVNQSYPTIEPTSAAAQAASATAGVRAEAKTEPVAGSCDEAKADMSRADHETPAAEHIFIVGAKGAEGAGVAPEHSIAAESLEGLPSSAAASFVGNVDVGELASPSASAIDPAALQFEGVDDQPEVDPDQSGLGSFFKKLPR